MLCRRPRLPCTHATRQAPSTPLVNCSQREGSAQVILEAIQSGTPVLASRISGNLGMLGPDYAGYFATGDDSGLAALVRRCAADPDFLALLQTQCADRASLFEPQSEKHLVINLLACALNDPIGLHNSLPGLSRL